VTAPAVWGAQLGDVVEAGPWRAIDVYRVITLGYAVILFAPHREEFRHPYGAWAVLGVMAGWTAFLAVRRARPTWILWLDLGITVACLLSTALLDDPARIARGAATLTSMWAAAPVASFALGRGWRAGLLAASVISGADVVEVWPDVSSSTVESILQLLLIGVIVGWVAELYGASRVRLAHATAVEAAARERDRLAADIHDEVLQVLAYVQRRGAELGGEAAEIGRLAGEQESRLRALVSAGAPASVGDVDLSKQLAALGGSRVSVAVPADDVVLPAEVALPLVAAVRTALDNVARHAGADARAWVLLEDEHDMVTITVRDDGVGMPAGRLEAAAAEGRLGVATGIRRRVDELGGTVVITSGPGDGTEVELQVPRRSAS
jgi:signal transduction histidine kinase